jgi:hypothetical protein
MQNSSRSLHDAPEARREKRAAERADGFSTGSAEVSGGLVGVGLQSGKALAQSQGP